MAGDRRPGWEKVPGTWLYRRIIMDIMEGAWMFFQIILLDLALGGDNSIVIGMAAKGLPAHLQRKVIFWGTAGAIIARAVLALILVWLLAIPYLKTFGGLILVYIGMKLIGHNGKEEEMAVEAKGTLWGAIQTVIVADVIMSLDNVLGIVAATDGNIFMLVVGMLISVPIIIVGSSVVVKIMDRFPWIIFAGSLVIGWAAGSMIATDEYMGLPEDYALYLKIGMTLLVAAGGWVWQKLAAKKSD